MAENHFRSMIAHGAFGYQANFQTNTETIHIGHGQKGDKIEQQLFTFLMDIVNTNFTGIANRLEEAILEKSLVDFWNEQKTLSQLLQPPIKDYRTYLIEKTCSDESDITLDILYYIFYKLRIRTYMSFRQKIDINDTESKDLKDLYITFICGYLQELSLPHDFIELIMLDPTYRNLSDFHIFTKKIGSVTYNSLYPMPYSTNWQTLDNTVDRFIEYKRSSNDAIVGDYPVRITSLPFACLELLITHNEFHIHKCDNCGKYFVDLSPNERFCNNKAPQSSNQTCRELLTQIVYKATDINELPGRIKKIRDRKYQAMKRNPEDTDFAEDFEKFSDLAKRIRKAYRTQTISEQRYLAWVAEAEASDITPNFNFN